jgi:hypothetical protein
VRRRVGANRDWSGLSLSSADCRWGGTAGPAEKKTRGRNKRRAQRSRPTLTVLPATELVNPLYKLTWRESAGNKMAGPEERPAMGLLTQHQNENVFVTNHSWLGFTRTEAQVFPSGSTETGRSPSFAKALRMFNWIFQFTFSVILCS